MSDILHIIAVWFDVLCIIAAGILAAISLSKATTVMFLEFVFHQILYRAGIVETSILEGGFLYLSYASIQILVLSVLYYYRAKRELIFLVFLNFLANLTLAYRFVNTEFISIHYQYAYIVGTIMLLELLVMGEMANESRASRKHKSNSCDNYRDIVFRFRCLCWGVS